MTRYPLFVSYALFAIAFMFAVANSSCTSPDSSMASHNQPELKEAQFSTPPVAEKQPHITEIHGLQLEDDYFWMRLSDEQKEADAADPQTTKVVDYLNAENTYKTEVMKGTEPFQETDRKSVV